MNQEQERQAVFWCGLLRPVLYGEIPRGGVAAFLREVASEEVRFPNGERKCPSVSTLKKKLYTYQGSGFDALFRKERSDKGISRAVPAEVISTAVQAKAEQPYRSDQSINEILEARHGKRLSRSTLYRHLKKAGATRKKLGISKVPVRKRWTCEHSHDMWIGDLSDGPYVLLNGASAKTHLSAFIDVHSRYIVSARYYLREDLDVLCDTLVRGLSRHGLPLALYLDNAKVYHSHSLKKLCWRHSIRLCHRPVRDPAPGGLIERFFKTVQDQFEREVRAGEILDLQKLNRTFWAWLDVMYHSHIHSETKEMPKERFSKGLGIARQADLATIAECFLKTEKRTVDATFSDIRLHGRLYKVDPKLRGDRIEVRFDALSDRTQIYLYSLTGAYLGTGALHQREQGEKPPPHSSPGPVTLDLLDVLESKQQKMHEAESIDYAQATRARPWAFEAFAACLAGLIGRKGGVSAWSAEELVSLQAVHAHHPRLRRAQLKKACTLARHKTVPAILHALKTSIQKES